MEVIHLYPSLPNGWHQELKMMMMMMNDAARTDLVTLEAIRQISETRESSDFVRLTRVRMHVFLDRKRQHNT